MTAPKNILQTENKNISKKKKQTNGKDVYVLSVGLFLALLLLIFLVCKMFFGVIIILYFLNL